MVMRQRNFPLSLGIGLSLVVLGLAVFGPAVAPHDPMQGQGVLQIDGIFYGGPPLSRAVPPFKDGRFPLGTDQTMRDVLSRLLWAVRPTLILCALAALVRVGIGTVLGVLAGWCGGRVARVIDTVISISLSVPILAVAVAVALGVDVGNDVATFVLALAITGWCDTAAVARTRTHSIRSMPYIESARAIGRGTPGIVWWHVLPQLRPLIPMVLAFELASVLLLLAELGYVGYYLGGGSVYEYTIGNVDRQYLLRTGAPELGQMLSDFFTNLYRTPWIPVFAGGLVFLAMAAFALLGEGLRRELDVTRPRGGRWWQRRGAGDRPPYGRRVGVPWGVTSGAAVLLIVGVLLAGRVHEQSAPEGSAARWSTTPVAADHLARIDLASVATPSGLLPDGFSMTQMSERLPSLIGPVPPPVQVLATTLARDGAAAGDVLIVLYADRAQRDDAFAVLTEPETVDDFGGRVTVTVATFTPAVGERAYGRSRSDTVGGAVSTAEARIVFTRCGAVVSVRVAGQAPAGLAEAATTIATNLDTHLAPVVCQPMAATAGNPS